ncbi:MAG: Wzy polymerase domain-containing protein [Candidatus Nitricoxidivorans perseverans]|uniref:Wzy polymerase domain-containing protein n=1 Tax=Candidatus Nitricoxidivorans perseverans TaxID=2975601 RepID=A0AA49FJD0_9PROT|nr:MAG: Wzy polymerase domain-containing protein [Candidatus Nitricoxidivorans perseverans]
MTHSPPPTAPRLALALVAVFAALPFLHPLHYLPLVNFWNEWWSAILGLGAVAAAFLLPGHRRLSLVVPAMVAVPGLLLAVVLLQLALGRIEFPRIGLLYALYLLWAALLILLGRRLAQAAGLARFAGVVAAALLFGALLGAGLAMAQWLYGATTVPWLLANAGGGSFANLGQVNHHAHHLWMGIASAFYLRGRGSVSRRFLWLAVIPLVFGSVISGSRSVFLYPIIILAVVAWARRRAPEGSAKSLLTDAMLLLPAVVALNFLGSWASIHLSSTAILSASRLYESVSGASVRWTLARTAGGIVLEHPWLGQGAGGFAWASFQAAARSDGGEFMVAEHAHNFPLDLAVEFGLPAAAAVTLLLVRWGWRFVRGGFGAEQAWIAAILAIGVVHALLEYPLWYAYFLGPTALLMGAVDVDAGWTIARRRAAIYLASILAGGAFVLAFLRFDYVALETTVISLRSGHSGQPLVDRLVVLQKESLLSPWALLTFVELIEPSRRQARERAVLCERGIRLAPARALVTRCAMQLAIAGRGEDAAGFTRAVLRAFPAEQTATADELAKGAQIHPEIEPLRQLSREPS